jgi:tetratricopeptide (TPR) repeat protein
VTPPAGLAGWTNRLEHARDLAARGAVHAAESEFREVLTDFANANDVQTGTGEHLQRLSAGWLALHEAEDFYRLMSSLNPTHDLARVIETHRTTVLSSAAPDRLTPPIAVQAYHAFARRSFVQALSDSGGATGATSGGRAGLAADGLYGLARIQHSLVASSRNRPDSAATANSITLLQAALAIAPRHAESANELGVLMARLGRNEEASQLFEQALAVKPSAELWHNYAAVLSQLGKESEATAARQQHERLQAAATRSGTTRGTAANAPDIRWVSLEEFAEAGPAPVEHAKATSQDGAAVHRTPEGPAAPGTAGTPSVRPTRSLFRWLRPGSS